MKPNYQLSVDGDLINLQGRLISLSLIDKRGFEADQLTIEIDDHDGRVALPRKGAVIQCRMGWYDELVDKGSFIVDKITHTGPADKIIVTAHSADFRNAFTEQKEYSWHNITLNEVITQIAKTHGFTPLIDQQLASIRIDHIDQTNESDAHFLTRLSERYHAIATIKSGNLLFITRSKTQTASQQDLPLQIIRRSDGDSHTYNDDDQTGRITGVRAYWYDKANAKKQVVTVGQSGYIRSLKQTYPTESDAMAAANALWQTLQRGVKKLSLTLAMGDALLIPESPCQVTGYKAEIDAVNWLIHEVTHQLNEQGFTTAIQLEELL